jgi:type IV secretory pathway VirB6-like protein
MPEEDWKKISGIVAQIIYEVKKMEKSDFMKVFKDSGIFTEAAVNVFDRLIENDYTTQDIEKIIKVTEIGLVDMEYVIELYKDGTLEPNEKITGMIKDVLENKDTVIRKLKDKMK